MACTRTEDSLEPSTYRICAKPTVTLPEVNGLWLFDNWLVLVETSRFGIRVNSDSFSPVISGLERLKDREVNE